MSPNGANHEIVEGPIDEAAMLAKVQTPACGAVSTFHGVVRDNSLGRQVRYLFYEAYPPMALSEMQKIEQELREQWELERVAITHRIGRLEIGEASVVIAISSAHRRDAIEACHQAIDRLKETVPIWKKEFWEGGEVWLENPHSSTIIRAQP